MRTTGSRETPAERADRITPAGKLTTELGVGTVDGVIQMNEDQIEAGVDELWRTLTWVGTKRGPTWAECDRAFRSALKIAYADE